MQEGAFNKQDAASNYPRPLAHDTEDSMQLSPDSENKGDSSVKRSRCTFSTTNPPFPPLPQERNSMLTSAEEDWLLTLKRRRSNESYECYGINNDLRSASDFSDTLVKSEQISEQMRYMIDRVAVDQKLTDDQFFEHVFKLDTVFNSLDNHNVKLNPAKANLFYKQLAWLGYTVSKGQRAIDPSKAQGYIDWPRPYTAAQLHSFVASLRFFASNIPNFELEVAPLDAMRKDMTKNQVLSWTAEQDSVFKKVRMLAATNLCRTDIDFDKIIYLVSDASGGSQGSLPERRGGIAGILYQHKDDNDTTSEKIIIACFSKMLTKQQEGWSTLDQELLGVVESLNKFRKLTGERQIIVLTDHANIVHMVRNLYLTTMPRTMRMVQELTAFDLIFRHVKGIDNIADHPSRAQVPDAAHQASIKHKESAAESDSRVNAHSKLINISSVISDCSDVNLCDHIPEDWLAAVVQQQEQEQEQRRIAPIETRNTDKNQAQTLDYICCDQPWCRQWHLVDSDSLWRTKRRADKNVPVSCQDLEDINNKRSRCFQDEPDDWYVNERNLYDDEERDVIKNSGTRRLKLNKDEALNFCHNGVRGHVKAEELHRRVQEEHSALEITRKECDKFIKGCPLCQKRTRHNRGVIKHAGKSTNATTEIARHWVFDHVEITHQPDIDGFKYVLAFVDRMSRTTRLYPSTSTDAKEAANALVKLALEFGAPLTLSTDKGSGFTSDMFNEFVRVMNAGIRFATTARPQAIGIGERSHQSTLDNISQLFGIDPEIKKKWSRHLPRVSSIINGTKHSATGLKPEQLLYAGQVDTSSGRKFNANANADQQLNGQQLKDLTKQLLKEEKYFHENAERIHQVLAFDAQRYRELAGSSLRAIAEKRFPQREPTKSYQPGDLILIKGKPDTKLDSPWKGPVQVTYHRPGESTLTYTELAREFTGDIHMDRTKRYSNSHNLTIDELRGVAGQDHNIFVPVNFIDGIFWKDGVKEADKKARNALIEVEWLEGGRSVHPANDFKQNKTFQRDVLSKEEDAVKKMFKIADDARVRPAVQRRQLNEEEINFDDMIAIGDEPTATAASATVVATPNISPPTDDPTPTDTDDQGVSKATNLAHQGLIVVGSLTSKQGDPAAANSIKANVLLDTGAQACNCIHEEVAKRLIEIGAGATLINTRINGFAGAVAQTTATRAITIKLRLSFENNDIDITDKFVVVDKLNHDLILGDEALAKANIIRSPIKELQRKIDALAALSNAEVQINCISIRDLEDQEPMQPSQAAGPDTRLNSLERNILRLQLQFGDELIDLKKLNEIQQGEDDLPSPGAYPEFVRSKREYPIMPARLKRHSITDFQGMTKTQLDNYSSAVVGDHRKVSLNPALSEYQVSFARAYIASRHGIFACQLGSAITGIPPMTIRRAEEHKHKQVWCHPRQTTPEGRQTIKEQLDEMLEADVIRRSTNPLSTSPVHLVKLPGKKDRFTIGTYNFYCAVNILPSTPTIETLPPLTTRVASTVGIGSGRARSRYGNLHVTEEHLTGTKSTFQRTSGDKPFA